MKIATKWITLAIVAGAVAFFSFRIDNSPVDTATKGSAMITEWERAKVFTKEYLDVMNEEGYGLKPSPEMRSFAEQMLHLAEANFNLASTATGKTSPYGFGKLEGPDQDKSKAAVSKIVLESYDYVIASIKGTDDTKMPDIVKVFNMFDLSRETTFNKVFEHQTHHRGQATVYIRLKGIKPPNEKLF